MAGGRSKGNVPAQQVGQDQNVNWPADEGYVICCSWQDKLLLQINANGTSFSNRSCKDGSLGDFKNFDSCFHGWYGVEK